MRICVSSFTPLAYHCQLYDRALLRCSFAQTKSYKQILLVGRGLVYFFGCPGFAPRAGLVQGTETVPATTAAAAFSTAQGFP